MLLYLLFYVFSYTCKRIVAKFCHYTLLMQEAISVVTDTYTRWEWLPQNVVMKQTRST